jgi:ATP-dependent DNA helicase RecQ
MQQTDTHNQKQMTDLDRLKHVALTRYFGYTKFRPMQEEIIDSVLAGHDTFVLMPTGGGKSLCYQIPALVIDGLTVVVSPLIALMKDQVDTLVENGVPATFLNSSISSTESSKRLKAIFRGETRLLYLAPERLLMPEFLEILAKLPLRLLAIDEAHCISEWGHDFRREYRQLNRVREMFPNVPVVALTATATERVQKDIVFQLRLRDPQIFHASFRRKNLFYEVRTKQKTYDQVKKYLRGRKGDSGIIYCGSRKIADNLAERLSAEGFPAVAYHAGLTNKQRTARQDQFIRDNVQIIVATIAFGMGIDKPNIRWVIHYDLPRNLEGYYQETGRAGRDGLPSECILFYSYGDRMKIDYFIDEKSPHLREIAKSQLLQVIAFAESTVCRNRQIAEYFGEKFTEPNCGMCDNCTRPVEQFDATVMAQKFLSAVKRTGERFGASYIVDVLNGSVNARIQKNRHEELTVFGIGKDHARKEWMQLARQLIATGYIVQGEYNVLRLLPKSHEVLFNSEKIFMRPVADGKPSLAAVKAGAVDTSLFDLLRAFRKKIADKLDLPPYVVFNDATLRDMALRKPTTLEAFAAISGVGERKLEQYGEMFVGEIRRYLGK